MGKDIMKRALITGITGFVGSHLAELLLDKGYEVYGTVRHRSRMENIEHLADRLKLVETELTDSHSTFSAISKIEPEYIFHLAGQSFVLTSWHAPQETVMINTIGTLNVLEAVRRAKIDSRIQVCGSSEEYGRVLPDEVPIKETNPLRPLSPYGVSKVAEDMFGVQYHKSYGMKTVVTRAFNHTGPRRGDVFATSNFAKQIVMIEKGKQKPVIRHGNLDAKRDFTDVRDTVKAYELSLQKGKFGEEYNICSGKTITMQRVLEILLSFSNVKITTEQDPERMRPSDVEILQGDYSKFKAATGWEPKIPFEQTMEDLLNYWRENIK